MILILLAYYESKQQTSQIKMHLWYVSSVPFYILQGVNGAGVKTLLDPRRGDT